MISLLGTTALLFEAPGAMDLPTQRRIWALAREAETWPEVAEAVPGMSNLMLTFTVPPPHVGELEVRVLAAWEAATAAPLRGRTVELPVVYGGPGGPHLDDVMAHTGLGIDDIVALHTAPDYIVYALGSHPGYCYLGGMDPRLATPRRQVPVLQIPGGAVSIGGAQTGVSASAGPSGWNTIGCTDFRFFDILAEPPALFRPGDCLRLVATRVNR